MSSLSSLKRRMTRKRSPASSISSLSSVTDGAATPPSIMHISTPITPPITAPFFGGDVDLTLDMSRFEAYRPAPSPPTQSPPALTVHAAPARPPRSPRSPEFFARSPPSRPAPRPPTSPRTEVYAKHSRRHSDESVSSTASAAWRSQMVDVAMTYATLTSANPGDFVATTTARAHHTVVVRRLSDPQTTELEALAILRGYIDQVHSSSRGPPKRSHSRDFGGVI